MKLISFIFPFLVCLSVASYSPNQDFDDQLKAIVKPYLFSIAGWELKAIPGELHQWLLSRPKKLDGESLLVEQYFSSTVRNKSLKSTVEKILEKQIRDTLSGLDIYNPALNLKIGFPPVAFSLEKPPYVLVISPKDRIESIREITLRQNLTLPEIENIEAKADALGVSSLIIEIGGLGATYPAFVSDSEDLSSTIDAAVEEWVHQYLTFRPLGLLYVVHLIGLSTNYDIVTMDETLASMVSKEIGALVYKKYYSQNETGSNQTQTTFSGFDFNVEMRGIRKTVDVYLSQGEIEQAEEFMNQKQQYLAENGYYIRKLNQAYFAFYGTYADSPTSIDPIGQELRQLRSQSASLKEYLNTVAAMSSRQDLIMRIK